MVGGIPSHKDETLPPQAEGEAIRNLQSFRSF